MFNYKVQGARASVTRLAPGLIGSQFNQWPQIGNTSQKWLNTLVSSMAFNTADPSDNSESSVSTTFLNFSVEKNYLHLKLKKKLN